MKPVEVSAIQFTGETSNVAEILAEVGEGAAYVADQGHIVIYTLDGPMIASEGDWIIKDGDHVHPLRPDIFSASYEIVA